MAIGVKVLDRPIPETSYIRATLKGMATTMKHLLNPEKVTIQYPEEKWSLSPRWRGPRAPMLLPIPRWVAQTRGPNGRFCGCSDCCLSVPPRRRRSSCLSSP